MLKLRSCLLLLIVISARAVVASDHSGPGPDEVFGNDNSRLRSEGESGRRRLEQKYVWRYLGARWSFTLTCATPSSCAAESQNMELIKSFVMNHELSGWARTRDITITRGARAKSRPMTFPTGYENDPDLLLSVFLHEQIHHLQSAFPTQFKAAMKKVAEEFSLPMRTLDERRDVAHFVVIYYQILAGRKILGAPTMKQVVTRHLHNKWIYRSVDRSMARIRGICRRTGLMQKVAMSHCAKVVNKRCKCSLSIRRRKICIGKVVRWECFGQKKPKKAKNRFRSNLLKQLNSKCNT